MPFTLNELEALSKAASCPTCRDLATDLLRHRQGQVLGGSARSEKKTAAVRKNAIKADAAIECTCGERFCDNWRDHKATCRRYMTMYQREYRKKKRASAFTN